MSVPTFSSSPPEVKHSLITYPAPHVLLVTFNHAKQMNSLPLEASWELDRFFKWFDDEPELRVGIVTGAGNRAFSAGMDLKEASTILFEKASLVGHYPDSGFAALTRRTGKKPIIAAVNGHAHGGGMEIAINADLILASENATFCLPDVKRGTAGFAGGLPRLIRLFGLQRANLIALTAHMLTPQEAQEWGLVCKITKSEDLMAEAIKLASTVAAMSPDSVVVSRAGIRKAWAEADIEQGTEDILYQYGHEIFQGHNAKEGMMAFMERREPKWKGSKL